jgi:hypothetical protein
MTYPARQTPDKIVNNKSAARMIALTSTSRIPPRRHKNNEYLMVREAPARDA